MTDSRLFFAAQTQGAVHVIQIGNSFYDVIPITNPSSSTARCHHHGHCRRGFHIRHSASNSSLDINSHTNPTFVLDEGVYPSGKPQKSAAVDFSTYFAISAPPPGLEAPPSYDEVIRLPNHYPKITSSTSVTPVNENPPTIAEIEANGHSITTLTSSSPAVITSQTRSYSHQATTVSWGGDTNRSCLNFIRVNF